jgi:hypothetical protein
MNNLCGICNDELGLKWCSCSYILCPLCYDNLTKPECPGCRSCLLKKIYFAGKIVIENNINETRIIVLDSYDINRFIEIIQTESDISIPYNNDVLKFNNYINLQNPIPMPNYQNKYIITGPCVIINGQNLDYCHFNTHDLELTNLTDKVDILNKRNKEMINNCDIFILTINEKMDCYCSFKEWGIAYALGKILILNILEIIDNFTELYTYAQDSLSSFENINILTRDTIIKHIPNFKFSNWISYKKALIEIIEHKNIRIDNGNHF